MTETKRRRRLWATLPTATALVLGLGAYWFQPWKLWQDATVHEALPTSSAKAAGPAPASSAPPPGPRPWPGAR